MKVKVVKNVSDKRISILVKDGTEIFLPPNQSWEDIDVINLDKLKEKVTYVVDLTEVGKEDSSNNSKVKLYDRK